MVRRPVLGMLAAALSGAPLLARADGDAQQEWMSRHGGREPATATPSRAQRATAAARDAAADLVIAAMNFLDRPYRRGGVNPTPVSIAADSHATCLVRRSASSCRAVPMTRLTIAR